MSGRVDPPVALSIAGSDSGAGAGIQADIKTMAALGVFATTAVTAVTAQNTTAVQEVHLIPVPMIDAQIAAVFEDFRVAAVKTGMLGSAEVVEVVGRRAAHGDLPQLVVDPVMVASTGRIFLDGQGVDAYRRLLLPHTLVTTPNLWEAALLADVDPTSVRDVEAMGDIARRIHAFGPAYVLVKGGHLPGVEPHDPETAPPQVADVLFDGSEMTTLAADRVDTANTHGTGCSLSSAITALLASGADVPAAVAAAKEFVHRSLVGGAEWHLGKGHGPLDHFGWHRVGSPD
ncbi:MAG: bifunctional hydroxymethylpyrimidine kinase/phosphomethylpyrimidine kinase [Acidimicrobiales bacterium]